MSLCVRQACRNVRHPMMLQFAKPRPGGTRVIIPVIEACRAYLSGKGFELVV
jgi:hypothetical protein